jgi:DNA-binding response OmpR family regulator
MTAVLKAGNIVIDRARYTVWVDDESVGLTYTEFELLATLIRHRGAVLSPAQLMESVWGPDADDSSRKVAVHISRLRRKISRSRPYSIRTVAKRGYSLSEANPRPGGEAFGSQGLNTSALSRGLSGGS